MAAASRWCAAGFESHDLGAFEQLVEIPASRVGRISSARTATRRRSALPSACVFVMVLLHDRPLLAQAAHSPARNNPRSRPMSQRIVCSRHTR